MLPPLALLKEEMMGIVDDYISGLEGKENPDLTTVVSDLLKLHNEEVGTRESKINEITATLSERDSEIAARDSEIQKWKAANFDLAMQIPGNQNAAEEEPTELDGSNITPDDLFES